MDPGDDIMDDVIKYTIEMRTQSMSRADIQLKRYENELNVKPHRVLTLSRKSMHTRYKISRPACQPNTNGKS